MECTACPSTSTWNDESRRHVIKTTYALKRLVISRCLDEISSTQFANDCNAVMEALASYEGPKATIPASRR